MQIVNRIWTYVEKQYLKSNTFPKMADVSQALDIPILDIEHAVHQSDLLMLTGYTDDWSLDLTIETFARIPKRK